MPRDNSHKAVENKIRSRASRAGLVLQRNPSRTPSAPGYGLYRLGDGLPYSLTIAAAERALKVRRDHPNGWTKRHTRTVRWLTPKYMVDALGSFDLDPAGAPGHELAAKTYLLENGDDGLRDPWFARVWLNPPYDATLPFMRRLVEHGQGTALLFARTDTAVFAETVWNAASSILFLRGRVSFLRPDGEAGSPAGAPSCLVTYGRADTEAARECGLPGAFIDLRR